MIASAAMKGSFAEERAYALGDVVYENGTMYSLTQQHFGDWDSTIATTAVGETVEFGDKIYSWAGGGANLNAGGTNTLVNPQADIDAGRANWVLVGSDGATSLTANNVGVTGTDAVATNGEGNVDGTYFVRSPWQHFANATGTFTGTANDPTTAGNASITDRTSEYIDVTNTSVWTKTHYGELKDRTVGTNYTYGDNIFYQGKHYIYTSHLDSNDPIYVSPTDDGYTEFDDLLRLGAIRELPMYVDTVGGGGGANLPEGIYYRPNQDLQFVDRLSNAGTVRTNSVERRTDAPLPPGDEIFNSADDQFYGGLNAGNDGIFGTLDDFYATTADPNIAMNGGHVDADADNNKNLLNTANGLENFSVADFVDYIQTLANVRAVNGGTQSRLVYANRMLEENEINLGAATSRIMDADMAYESTKMAQQNVLLQAGASMVTQANQLSNIVLSLLQ